MLVCVAFVFSSHLQVRPVILGNKRAVTLAQHRDLLLNVFDLIFRLLQVDNFDGHHFLRAIVDAFVDLSEGTLPDPLLFGKVLLRVQSGILGKNGMITHISRQIEWV